MLLQRTKPSPFTQPGAYSLLLACGWTLVIVVSLMVSITVHRRERLVIAKNVARAYIDRDILYRNWNAFHGGVYVSTDNSLLPSPFYPPSVKDRDISTPSGRRLTLVNPAYMTRQIYELAQKENKVSSRITSLKPLRPENKADLWETLALQNFERGAQEFSSLTEEGGRRFLRLMRPLVTEKNCLACHAHQGYKVGDIRGGISIRLPIQLFEPWVHSETGLLLAGHCVLWLLGLAGLYTGFTGLRRRTRERDFAENELKRVNAILEDQATTDSLTGICNRRKFLDYLQMKMLENKRYDIPAALIFFDIDHFKAVNDTWGHETGDGVLQELTRIVSGMIRKTDIFARLGGEEFVVLLHNNDIGTGRNLAEKIRHCVEQHVFSGTGTITCSFGVAELHSCDTPESIIKRADDAMYAAKQAGRNRVAIGCRPSSGPT